VGPGFSPLDDELALLPGSLTPAAHVALVRLATDLEFTPAATLLATLTGIHVSEPTARRLTEAAGAVLVAAQTAAAPACAPPADPGPDTALHLQASVDGAMIALVGGTWAEVRTLVIGEVHPTLQPDGRTRPQATTLSYFSRLAPASEFIQLSAVETARRGLRAARAVAAVMDGAEWLQSWIDYHRPDAVRILDHAHALDHLHQAAQAVWGTGAVATAWWEAQKQVLHETGPSAVMHALTELAEQAQDPDAYSKQIGYLAPRAAQMAYPTFRAAGWPIGSGIVESGNKVVVQRRLKGAGMRWAVAHVNPLLALRNGLCSDRWDETIRAVLRGRRAEVALAQAARRARRPGAPVPPPPVCEATSEPPAALDAAIVAEVERILTQVGAEWDAARQAASPQAGKPSSRHPWRQAFRYPPPPLPDSANAKL
jgi:hypothetical protein